MRTPVLLTAVCLTGALGLAACGSSSSDTAAVPTSAAGTTAPASTGPTGTVITVKYAGGKVSGNTGRTKIKVGQPVTVSVTSDSKQQVHIHGADILFDVAAGTTASKTFTENAPGIYEIELHPSDFVLARVEAS